MSESNAELQDIVKKAQELAQKAASCNAELDKHGAHSAQLAEQGDFEEARLQRLIMGGLHAEIERYIKQIGGLFVDAATVEMDRRHNAAQRSTEGGR